MEWMLLRLILCADMFSCHDFGWSSWLFEHLQIIPSADLFLWRLLVPSIKLWPSSPVSPLPPSSSKDRRASCVVRPPADGGGLRDGVWWWPVNARSLCVELSVERPLHGDVIETDRARSIFEGWLVVRGNGVNETRWSQTSWEEGGGVCLLPLRPASWLSWNRRRLASLALLRAMRSFWLLPGLIELRERLQAFLMLLLFVARRMSDNWGKDELKVGSVLEPNTWRWRRCFRSKEELIWSCFTSGSLVDDESMSVGEGGGGGGDGVAVGVASLARTSAACTTTSGMSTVW